MTLDARARASARRFRRSRTRLDPVAALEDLLRRGPLGCLLPRHPLPGTWRGRRLPTSLRSLDDGLDA